MKAWRSITIAVSFTFSGLVASLASNAENTGEMEALQQLAVVEAELQRMLAESLKGMDQESIRARHAIYLKTLSRFKDLQAQAGEKLVKADVSGLGQPNTEWMAIPARSTYSDYLVEPIEVGNPILQGLRSARDVGAYRRRITQLARNKIYYREIVKRSGFVDDDSSSRTRLARDLGAFKSTIRRAAMMDLERTQRLHLLDASADHFVHVANQYGRVSRNGRAPSFDQSRLDYRGRLAEFAMFVLAIEPPAVDEPDRLALEGALAITTTELYQLVWQVASQTKLGVSALLRAQEPYVANLIPPDSFFKYFAGGYRESALKLTLSESAPADERGRSSMVGRLKAITETLNPHVFLTTSKACKRALTRD